MGRRGTYTLTVRRQTPERRDDRGAGRRHARCRPRSSGSDRVGCRQSGSSGRVVRRPLTGRCLSCSDRRPTYQSPRAIADATKTIATTMDIWMWLTWNRARAALVSMRAPRRWACRHFMKVSIGRTSRMHDGQEQSHLQVEPVALEVVGRALSSPAKARRRPVASQRAAATPHIESAAKSRRAPRRPACP